MESRDHAESAGEGVRRVLARLEKGEISLEQALLELGPEAIRHVASGGVHVARLDLGRERWTGSPEIVFGEGKAIEDLVAIVDQLIGATGRVLVTRIDADTGRRLEERFASGRYEARARLFRVGRLEAPSEGAAGERRRVSVVAAGTSDIGVAEEAALSLEWLGLEVERVYDVGVAAIGRVLAEVETIRGSQVVIVVAGMDGALPSVVAGLVTAPVVAVPTSVGYGSSFDGLSALLAMLNSCSPGVTVVNIDNGLGAAIAARRICRPGA